MTRSRSCWSGCCNNVKTRSWMMEGNHRHPTATKETQGMLVSTYPEDKDIALIGAGASQGRILWEE